MDSRTATRTRRPPSGLRRGSRARLKAEPAAEAHSVTLEGARLHGGASATSKGRERRATARGVHPGQRTSRAATGGTSHACSAEAMACTTDSPVHPAAGPKRAAAAREHPVAAWAVRDAVDERSRVETDGEPRGVGRAEVWRETRAKTSEPF
eukprot:2754469-Prymnesium_polylepis.1